MSTPSQPTFSEGEGSIAAAEAFLKIPQVRLALADHQSMGLV